MDDFMKKEISRDIQERDQFLKVPPPIDDGPSPFE